MSGKPPPPSPAKRVYRKNQPLLALISKMKLWPSRQGILHGIKELDISGDMAQVTTHCGHSFTVRNSRTSRAGRWLRNKSVITVCPACGVPDWKVEKYQSSFFKKKSGAVLDRPAQKRRLP